MNDRVRKPVFHLLTIVFVWAVVEVAAVAGHAVLDGRLFSPGAVRDRVRAVASPGTEAGEPQGSPAAARDSGGGRGAGRWVEVIHPYFGVVVDPERHRSGAVSDLGFVEGTAAAELARRSPDTAVIGVFGGSFALGIYRQLDKLDGARIGGREVVAVNFAKAGYKQPQQLMVLAYLLALGVELDVVVNVDGFNEVALPPVENLARGVNPFYPRQWHLKARSALDPEIARRVGYLEYLEAQRRRRARPLLVHGLYRSAALSLAWRAFDRNLEAAIAEARGEVERADAERTGFKLVPRSWECLAAAGVDDQVMAALRPLRGRRFEQAEDLHRAVAGRLGAGRAAEHRAEIGECAAKVSVAYATHGPKHRAATDDELYRDLVTMWQRSSRQMDALCAAYGVRYFHFLQPNQYLEGSKPMSAQERRIAINPAQHYRRGAVRGYPLLRESGRGLLDHGVAFTDLTMIFEDDPAVRYADDCCHLNKQGYAAVVDRILETVAAGV